MDHPKSGLPDFGRFKCASRVNPTCVVKPGGDGTSAGSRARLRRRRESAPRRRRVALILPAGVSSCAAVLLRGSIPSCLRAPVPPEARSGPFPARLAGGVAIWCRRPNACTLARTRGILWGMRPWRALRGGQAGARPVSQPPAPACELPVMKVKISHRRRLR